MPDSNRIETNGGGGKRRGERRDQRNNEQGLAEETITNRNGIRIRKLLYGLADPWKACFAIVEVITLKRWV